MAYNYVRGRFPSKGRKTDKVRINRPGEIIGRTQDVLLKLHDYMTEEGIDESVWKMVSAELKSKSLAE